MSGAETLLIAAGTGLAAYSAVQQGQAASAQAKAQQRSLEAQAAVREQQAEREGILGEQGSTDFLRQQSRQRAAIIAARGGRGAEQFTGSLSASMSDFDREVALQAARLRNTGDLRSTRLLQQAAIDEAGADAFGQSASDFETAGLLQAGAAGVRGGSLLLDRPSTDFSGGTSARFSTQGNIARARRAGPLNTRPR